MKKRIFSLLLILFILLPTPQSFALDWSEGTGGKPNQSGVGGWWGAEGVGSAWSEFSSAQSGLFGSATSLANRVNASGKGAIRSDGSYEPLSESCKKSEYIFWYGSYENWVASDGFSYKPKMWYSNSTNSTAGRTNKLTTLHAGIFNKYKNSSTLWGTGKVVIICSYSFDQQQKPKLFFKANSGTFKYDGTEKTVSGFNPGTNFSALKPGHKHNAVATRTAIRPGVYHVKFNDIRITDGSGKDVTSEYYIETVDGVLTIIDEDPEGMPPMVGPREEWRCVDHDSDSAKAYVRNSTYGYEAFSAGGYMRSLEKSRYTSAGEFAISSRPPTKYQSYSAWRSWKNTFQSGSDTITPELDLMSTGISTVLSEYGGVYNIDRSLQQDTYGVTHCQPEKRVQKLIEYPDYSLSCWTNMDGKRRCSYYYDPYYVWEWQEWRNDGGRIVWSNSGPSTEYHESNYQILSVNCNKTGFQSALSQTGGTNLSLAGGDGGATLQTRERPGRNSGILGRSPHATSRKAFYTDGTSCEVFKCSADRIAGSDAANNKNNNPHGFQKLVSGGIEQPKDGYVTFFRENEDNEVRADIWHPINTGLNDLLSFPSRRASRTYGLLYSGSPEISLTTIAPKEDRGYPLTSFNNEEWWSGDVNKFIMKSQWASYKNKPYQLGLNWEYQGEARNHTPAKADGYGVKQMSGVYTYTFDLYCPFKNTNGTTQASSPKNPYLYNDARRIWDSGQAVRALFTRSVSDS